jgi:uncharacterized membrane protein YfcA
MLGAGGLALLAVAVLLGAGTQRLTGLGFALVSSPFLVLLLGAFQGVLVANLLSLVTNLVVLTLTWRHVAVRKVVLLVVPALALVVPGAWVARHLPAPVLLVVVGTLVVVALLVVTFVRRARVLHGTRGAVAAGGMSGFMNATAGVGGPAITLYAVSTDWDHHEFVGSMQLYFALLNIGSLAAKGLPTLVPAELVTALVALAVGSVAGQLLARRVSAGVARHATTGLAVAGALATVVKGLAAW